MNKDSQNIEAILAAFGDLARRVDRLEGIPETEDEHRELIDITLNAGFSKGERTVAVAKLDAYTRKDQAEHKAAKDALAKTAQEEWHAKTDKEMFAIEGTKPQLHHILEEIKGELNHARSKFPGDNVTFAALVEEVGELATAIFSESRVAVRKEAVQIAVMAIRVVLDGDCTFDDWREKHALDALTDVPKSEEKLRRVQLSNDEIETIRSLRSGAAKVVLS